MQDHFLQLGLDLDASRADIEAAINAHPERAAAAEILLNDRRRGPYQRTVSTLRSIGMLRHRLGLDNDDTWFVESCPDFAPRLHTRKFGAQPQAATGAAGTPAEEAMDGQPGPAAASPAPPAKAEKSPASRAWLKPLVVILAIAAILLLIGVAF